MARTASGLMHSHNSDLDLRIPRAKAPKRALPDCLRKKIRRSSADATNDENSDALYKAGAGVLAPRGAEGGEYRAGSQRNFLKRGSGKPMSERASRLAQLQNGPGYSRGAKPTQSYLSAKASVKARPTGGELHSAQEKVLLRRQSMQQRRNSVTKRQSGVRRQSHGMGRFGKSTF